MLIDFCGTVAVSGAGNGVWGLCLFLEDELDKGGVEIVSNILVTLLLRHQVVWGKQKLSRKQTKLIKKRNKKSININLTNKSVDKYNCELN